MVMLKPKLVKGSNSDKVSATENGASDYEDENNVTM